MAFCGNCGASLNTSAAFCGSCGTPTKERSAAANLPERAARAKTRPSRLLMVVLLLAASLAIVVVGVGVYVGLRIKKKTNEIAQGVSQGLDNTLAQLKGNPSGLNGAEASPYPACDQRSHCTSAGSVPLRVGLTIVGAVNQNLVGDYESVSQVQSITPDAVAMILSADVRNPLAALTQALTGASRGAHAVGADPGAGESQHIVAHRTVRLQDIRDAHRYEELFNDMLFPRVIPGSTAFSASTAVLAELKSQNRSQWTYRSGGSKALLGSLAQGRLGHALAAAVPTTEGEGSDSGEDALHTRATLTRVEDHDVAFPVILNGERTVVPSVHAYGVAESESSDWYILDDPQNPLILGWKFGSTGERRQVVKIAFPPDQPSRQIEKSLKDTNRAEIQGIYFAFNSAVIRDESQPVLQEIADTLTRNGSWKIRVEGHTDNIGGEGFNLDLSQHRAEAVKSALVLRYHVAASRLSTEGFGASLPKESNATLEGRARNRRVELVRQ